MGHSTTEVVRDFSLGIHIYLREGYARHLEVGEQMWSFEPKCVDNVVQSLFRPGGQGQVFNLIIASTGE